PCSWHITNQDSTSACCRKEKLGRAMTLEKLLTVQSESAWPTLTPSCICQDIPASNCNARYGFLHSAGVGSVRSRRCSNKIRAPKLWQGIRDSPMRNNRQHGPDFDRCESRVFTRRAIASLPSFWSQSMGSFFL